MAHNLSPNADSGQPVPKGHPNEGQLCPSMTQVRLDNEYLYRTLWCVKLVCCTGIRMFIVKGSTRTFLTDTDILNVSYHGHGHVAMKCVRKCTRKRTLPTFHLTDTDILDYACQNTDKDMDKDMSHITCFCTDTDMYLYFVSVIRRHLQNLWHLRHLHIETLCFRLPKDKFSSAVSVPLSSPTRVLVRRDRA
jgi:hypothetical protein